MMRTPNAATDIFVDLVQIGSPYGHEAAVGAWVAERLANWGVVVGQDAAGAKIGGDSGNVIARLPGTRSGTPIMFCAHLDTVPHSGRVTPVIEDGVARSRGDTILGADNKASVAAILEATRRLATYRIPHSAVDLVFTVMEEAGCRGAAALDLGALSARVGFVFDHAGKIGSYVSDSPAGYLITVAYKGRAAHAGLSPELGRSAILAAARAIGLFRTGRVGVAGTVNVGVIQGGVAHNIVADECRFTVDIRSRSQAEADSLVAEVSAHCEAAGADVGCRLELNVQEKYRAYSAKPGDVVVSRAEAALQTCGATPSAVYAGSGSDACVFNARGLPCVNLGSGMENIHTSDEMISLVDIERMVDVILAIVAETD